MTAGGNEREAAGDDGSPLACIYATDRGFLPVTCFSIASLAANASRPVTIIVLTAAIPDADIEEARAWLGARGVAASFVAIPADAFDGLPRPKTLPLASYGRLLMEQLLPTMPHRLLYVDGDTLVDIDVTELAAVDLTGATIGAVLDIGRVLVGRREEARARLGLGPAGEYFNSGVLLIDGSRWRRDRIGARCLEALRSEPDRFVQGDQCALNMVLAGRWKSLPWRWNLQPAAMQFDDRARAIRHFLGGRKPWRGDGVRHSARYVQRYAELFAQSPWAGSAPAPRWPYPVLEAVRVAKDLATPRTWRNRGRYRAEAAREPR